MKARAMIVMLAAFAGLLAPHPASAIHNFFLDSTFCDQRLQFKGTSIVADGPAAQIDVHTQVFEQAFARACRTGSGQVTYLGTGEQAGINAIVDRNSERRFGTADVPMSPLEWAQATLDQRAPDRRGRNSPVHHIPLFVAVTTVGFNLKSCSVPDLKLRSQVLSLIYSGQVQFWNDRLLVADNPALEGCNFPIRVIKRADFAGSTATFKDYLSKRSPQWAYYKQPAQNQVWPTVTNACPALGEDGMAGCILTTPNSIGYLTLRTAKVNNVRTAKLDGIASAGTAQPFLAPTPQGCTTAAASAFVPPPVQSVQAGFFTTPIVTPTAGDWSTISLSDAPQGYPMCSFGYAFIYQNIQGSYLGQGYTPQQARTAIDYLWTAIGADAQSKLASYDYGPLPANVVEVSRAGLESIRFQT